jgi:hypothetical protein
MKVTVQPAIDDAAIASFYALYVAAFDPLRTIAAARHLLTADEFAAEMRDPRIDKYVAWDDEGVPVALTTLATDLTAVAWISPDHLAARYPEHAARGAIYYLGYTLAHPERGRRGFALTLAMVTRRLSAERAVCGYDFCAYNDGRAFGKGLARLLDRDGASVDRIDVQTYYAAEFAGVDG